MKKNKKKLGIIAGVILVILLLAAFTPFIFPWSYKNADPGLTNLKPDFNLSSLFLKYNFGDGENVYTNLSVVGTRGMQLKNYKVANMYFGLPVTSVAPSAFEGNTKLESITLPENIKYISANSFSGCTSLKTVSLPTTLVTISHTAFKDCTALEYNEYGNALYLGNEENPYLALISVINTTATEITLHENARVIADRAFADCSKLNSIVFNGSVVPVYSYSDITTLAKVTINGNATEVPTGAFAGCVRLSEINLPDTIKTIGNTAFSGCSALENIKLPASLESIGNSAFNKCQSLTSLELPETVTSIGNNAFTNCSKLESINIPNTVTYIGDYALS